MRRLLAALGVAAAVAPVALAVAGTTPTKATKPKTTITAAGTAAAQRALIGAGDLGAGWSAETKAPQAESLGCGASAKAPLGVVEIGAATTPTYEQSGSGPFVSEAAFVYRTPAEALVLWQRVAGPAVLSCLAQSVASGGAQGIRFTVLQRQQLSRPAPDTRSSAYRLVLRAKTTAQTISAYIDIVVLDRGAAVSALSFAGFSQPADKSLEVATAREVARRL